MMFEKIKGRRHLSFSHWRYRALHWSFGVDPATPEDSPLPKMFYTHYCPLFHITNLIVLFFPCVLLAKGARRLLILFNSWVDARLEADTKKTLVKMSSEEFIKKVAWKKFIDTLNTYLKRHGEETSFDYLWSVKLEDSEKNHLDKAECKETYERIKLKFLEIQKERAEAKAERQRRMAFWINFSSGLFKILVKTVYAAILLALGWCFVAYGIPWCIGCVAWLMSLSAGDILGFIWFCFMVMLTMIGVILTFLGVFYFFNETEKGERVREVFGMQIDLRPIKDAIKAPFVATWNVFGKIKDFTSEVYEDNCPPIEIVDEEEEMIREGLDV